MGFHSLLSGKKEGGACDGLEAFLGYFYDGFFG